jgi:hypothetical protein
VQWCNRNACRHYFVGRGCNRGQKCKFEHVLHDFLPERREKEVEEHEGQGGARGERAKKKMKVAHGGKRGGGVGGSGDGEGNSSSCPTTFMKEKTNKRGPRGGGEKGGGGDGGGAAAAHGTGQNYRLEALSGTEAAQKSASRCFCSGCLRGKVLTFL